MKEEFKKYQKSIRTVHRVGWTPTYTEEFKADIKSESIIPLSQKVFEDLEWEVVFVDNKSIEAKRPAPFNRFSEKITVTTEGSRIKVKSISLGNEIWDFGRNSKRVKLFIYAFQKTLEEFSAESLKNLELTKEREANWDDYIIPETLPPPPSNKSKPLILISYGLIAALLLGFIMAYLTHMRGYLPIAFEIGTSIALAYAFKWGLKPSNYTRLNILDYMILACAVLTLFSSLVFRYYIIIWQEQFEPIGLPLYFEVRLNEKAPLDFFDLGWIGWMIGWAIQLFFIFHITKYRFFISLIDYLIERIPPEVRDFAFYLFVKDRTEKQVREELAARAWTKKEDQDAVFASIEALHEAIELNRMD